MTISKNNKIILLDVESCLHQRGVVFYERPTPKLNNDGNNNTTNLLNNTNASLREIQYTNELYSTNNKCNSKRNQDIKDLFMTFTKILGV